MRRRRASIFPVIVFSLIFLATQFVGTSSYANNKYASFVIDANTGASIRARNADSARYPASLTKIMTLYILFSEITAGRIKKSDRIRFSNHAAAQAPSKLGLNPGETITVDHAIHALITKSANDVAAAIAEHISKTEWAFAKRMTKTAVAMGMKNTTFRNASGLPNSKQKTTARDMATLGLRMMTDHPQLYKMFKLKSFTFRGHTYGNHNRLLGAYAGTEGIKTGYTRASGFNLVASVRRGSRVAIGVVMGGKTASSRDAHMRQILDESFPKLSTRRKRSAQFKMPMDISNQIPQHTTERIRAQTKAGTIALQMTPLEPRHRELPLAEPISRDPAKSSIAFISISPSETTVVYPKTVRAAVAHADSLAPAALSAYQTEPDKRVALTLAIADSNKPDDAIERLIAKAKSAPDIASTSDPVESSVRHGRLIKPTQIADNISTRDYASSPLLQPTLISVDTKSIKRGLEIPDGYQIQVGAYARQSDAQRLLKHAQQNARNLLAKAIGYTPTVEKNSGTLYRARFAGLDKKSATRACSTLKKNRIDCIVVAR